MKLLKTQRQNKINAPKKEKKEDKIYLDLEEIKCLENDYYFVFYWVI